MMTRLLSLVVPVEEFRLKKRVSLSAGTTVMGK
jgi:hypothetical protein